MHDTKASTFGINMLLLIILITTLATSSWTRWCW